MKALVLAFAVLLAPLGFASDQSNYAEGWTVEGFDGSTTKNSATMIWRTAVPTTGILSVGLAPDNLSYREIVIQEYKTSHLVVVDNLPPNTRFYFSVLATDQDGVNVASEIISKKTKAP